MSGEVWVWLPRDREGNPEPALEELLHEGGALALRLDAALVAIGDRPADEATLARLAPWGVSALRVLSAPLPPHPVGGSGGFFLAEILPSASELPALFLFSANAFGKIAAPLWAAETGAALVTGASGITADGRNFVAARPTHGGQFEALVTLPLAQPLVATLLPGALGSVAPPLGGGERPPEVVPAGPAAGAVAAGSGAAGAAGSEIRFRPPDPKTLDLAEAERIVAFGRGAFHPQAVALVEKLAALLGAVVAGSRPAADEGWLPFSRQIGLTGAIVHPKLYVAVGISGAPYHMAGVKEPETLVAVNADPEAPIVGAAHLAIVGDLMRVVPELIEQLEAGQPLAPGIEGGPKGREA